MYQSTSQNSIKRIFQAEVSSPYRTTCIKKPFVKKVPAELCAGDNLDVNLNLSTNPECPRPIFKVLRPRKVEQVLRLMREWYNLRVGLQVNDLHKTCSIVRPVSSRLAAQMMNVPRQTLETYS